jgi:hypothetical protein
MNMKACLTLAGILVLACAAAPAGEASFSTKPTATKDGDKVKIGFAVGGPTDVEVAVLGADGKVVRHLAAGVLGGAKPPPEPLKAGLSQELVWDGKDDFGKPAAGGPFKVRARAGTDVKFGRFLADSPCAFREMVSMAADEAGNLYIIGYGGNRSQNARCIRAFDAEGHYLREIMPFPADLPAGAMKDIAAWDDQAKAWRPRNLTSLFPEFYGFGGTVVSASSKNGLLLADPTAVSRLDPRGSLVSGQALWGKQAIINTGGGPTFMAESPDGKYFYLTGPFSSKTTGGHGYDPKWPPGTIYRMKLGGGETMQPFATIAVNRPDVAEFEAGKNPHGAWMDGNVHNCGIAEGPVHGVAVDAKGNVYVADREKQRVAVFDENGKEIGELKVHRPHQIAVHPRTGEIYVLSRHGAGYWQYKIAVWKFKDFSPGAAPAAKHEFPQQGGANPQMALVASEKGTAVFVSGVGGGLVSLVDRGTALELTKTAFALPAGALDVFNRMATDQERDEVYLSDGASLMARFDGETGQGGLLKKDGKPFMALDLAVGYDGNLYARTNKEAGDFCGSLERYSRELAPVPFPSGTHVLSPYLYGRFGIANAVNSVGVGPDGKVYATCLQTITSYWVAGFGPEGKALKGKYLDGKVGGKTGYGSYPPELTSAVIGLIPQCSGGLRVDLAGNLYVGMIVGKTPVPKAFEKNEGYRHMTGSVVKFGPEGGALKNVAQADNTSQFTCDGAEGALNIYPGLSPFSHPHMGTTCCACRQPRFDLDRFGRLVIPNATGNYTLLVDNAGNEILNFGKYGNFDSQYVNENTEAGKAKKPTVAVPEIPLAWPTSAGFGKDRLYVMDVYNRRVVRCDLTWKAEESCEVK